MLANPGKAHRSDGCFAAAGDNNIGIVILDRLESIAHRIGGTSTGCDHRVIGTTKPISDRDVPTGRIDHELRES